MEGSPSGCPEDRGRRDKRDERRCPTTFSSGELGEEVESWKKLKKNGSCSFLNIQEASIFTQSSPTVIQKIRSGRARGPKAGTSC
jgi:hypothetical protein